MKNFQLISLSDGNCLELKCLDKNICFDTPVQISFCLENVRYLLLEDILGYALAELKAHFYKIDALELVSELLEMEIGKAQNEYYHRCAKDLPLDLQAIKEINERWIGNKYNCFESRDFSTWVYSIKKKSYFKITPLYSENYDENPKTSYAEFTKNYKVIYERSLEEKEVSQCQTMIKKIEKLSQR